MHEDLANCPVVIETPIAWGEMDAFQHVNNIVYLRYFESGRMAYFERLNFMEFMEKTGIGPILASIQCKFKIPLTYPDTVLIGTRVPKVEADRFTMEYYVVSHKHQKLAAQGEGVIVSFDYRENKKTNLPEELWRRITEVEASAAKQR
jgi:acyl-CoA thioester hydrolase